MKKIKYIIATVIASITIANAQQPNTLQQHCIGYKAKVASPFSGHESSKPLEDKIRQIIARNAASEHAVSQSFALIGSVDVTDTQTTDGLMRNMTIVYADFILEAVNLVDHNTYAVTSVKIQAQDYSKEKAIAKLVQSIKITDPVYAKFIKNANDKIINYYDKNMKVFMNKAQNLMKLGNDEEAIKVLQSIPECVPSYEQSSAAVNSLIDTLKEKELKEEMTEDLEDQEIDTDNN